MNEKEIIRYHTERTEKYLEFFGSEAQRNTVGMSVGEAAYNVLMHAGLLFRYSGSEEIIKLAFDNMSDDLITEIQVSAIRYASSTTILARAELILHKDYLEEDEIMQIEDLIISRDGLEAMLLLSVKLSLKFIENGNHDMLVALSNLRVLAAEFDDLLLTRPDIASVCSRSIRWLRDMIAIDFSKEERSNHWWFYKAVELDDRYTREDIELMGALEHERVEKELREIALLPAATGVVLWLHEMLSQSVALAAAGSLTRVIGQRKVHLEGYPLIEVNLTVFSDPYEVEFDFTYDNFGESKLPDELKGVVLHLSGKDGVILQTANIAEDGSITLPIENDLLSKSSFYLIRDSVNIIGRVILNE